MEVVAEALTDILGRPEGGADVEKVKRLIMEVGVVPGILAKQKAGGFWGVAENFYIKSKYKGTVWQLIALAELGAYGSDERVKRACEFILENSQDRESGGFSYGNQRDCSYYRFFHPSSVD